LYEFEFSNLPNFQDKGEKKKNLLKLISEPSSLSENSLKPIYVGLS